MLTTVEVVQAMPGGRNTAAIPVDWLNTLIGAADQAIKTYLKRDIELKNYTEYHDGNLTPSLILRQYPVWCAQTTIAAGSNGAVLPQATINVASTANFPPGTGGNPDAAPPVVSVQTGITTQTTFSYTGKTATTFTGCSGGTGTLATDYRVGTPTVFYDPTGYYGQSANAFAAQTQLAQGTQFVCNLSTGGTKGERGILTRIGGVGVGFVGFYPENYWIGKLAGTRLPSWPRGQGNLKVYYTAGYAPGQVPFDLQYAAAFLVSYMVRNLPSGGPLQSETLGAYSYTIMNGGQAFLDVPELGSLARSLAPYRESSW